MLLDQLWVTGFDASCFNSTNPAVCVSCVCVCCCSMTATSLSEKQIKMGQRVISSFAKKNGDAAQTTNAKIRLKEMAVFVFEWHTHTVHTPPQQILIANANIRGRGREGMI